MYSILTSNPTLAREPIGSIAYYIADGVSGRSRDPIEGEINSIACWGDTAAVRADPSRAALSADVNPVAGLEDEYRWRRRINSDGDARANPASMRRMSSRSMTPLRHRPSASLSSRSVRGGSDLVK